jgi:hypothetical protein
VFTSSKSHSLPSLLKLCPLALLVSSAFLPARAGPITSFVDYQAIAGSNPSLFLSLAVRGFFANGGQICYVARIGPSDPLQIGLDALAGQKLSILCCPDENQFPNAATVMADHCQKIRDRFCILQSVQPVIPDASTRSLCIPRSLLITIRG